MINISKKSVTQKESISVEFFYESTQRLFNLKLLTESSDLQRKIYDQNLHRPGLALAGFVELFAYRRVQVFGNTEMKYLNNLSEEDQNATLEKIFNFEIPCIILGDNNEPTPILKKLAENHNIPLFGCEFGWLVTCCSALPIPRTASRSWA